MTEKEIIREWRRIGETSIAGVHRLKVADAYDALTAERNELLDKLDRAQDSEVRREADALVELLRQEKVRAEAAEAERDALKAKVEQVKAEAVAVARGCHDYGGGYRSDDRLMEVYQHGIQTVENAMTAWAKSDGSDTQVNALIRIGGDQ